LSSAQTSSILRDVSVVVFVHLIIKNQSLEMFKTMP